MANEKIIEALKKLEILRWFEDDERRSAAYSKAIQNIQKYGKPIRDAKEAKTLKGVGQSIGYTIHQILNNTNPDAFGIKELDELPEEDKEKLNTMIMFMEEKGIGISRASEFYDEGNRTIDDLVENKPKIRTIEYSKELKERVSRETIDQWLELFDIVVGNINYDYHSKLEYTPAGSYRREKSSSGDIDIILYSKIEGEPLKYIDEIITELDKGGYILKELINGNIKRRYVATLTGDEKFQIDIELVEKYEQYPYTLLYFTGSDSFGIEIKQHAKDMGYKLGNNYMTDNKGRKVYVKNEEEIFDKLGLEYVEPKDRD